MAAAGAKKRLSHHRNVLPERLCRHLTYREVDRLLEATKKSRNDVRDIS